MACLVRCFGSFVGWWFDCYVGSQVRANTLLRSIIDGNANFFKDARVEMASRWSILRSTLVRGLFAQPGLLRVASLPNQTCCTTAYYMTSCRDTLLHCSYHTPRRACCITASLHHCTAVPAVIFLDGPCERWTCPFCAENLQMFATVNMLGCHVRVDISLPTPMM